MEHGAFVKTAGETVIISFENTFYLDSVKKDLHMLNGAAQTYFGAPWLVKAIGHNDIPEKVVESPYMKKKREAQTSVELERQRIIGHPAVRYVEEIMKGTLKEIIIEQKEE